MSGKILTVVIDLSHEAFNTDDMRARINLAMTIRSLTELALQGVEGSLIRDTSGANIGVYMVDEDDPDNKAKEAIKEAGEAFDGIAALAESKPASDKIN